jgi:hypothetical protein
LSFFAWIEATAFSTWMRESPSLLAFPFILYLHTLGLALLAGLSSAVAIAILALRERLPREAMLPLFPLMWLGLAINALSGLALLLAYPAKALTNPVFYIKLIAIAIAVGIVQWLRQQFARAPAESAGGAAAIGGAAIAPSPQAFCRAAWLLLALWAVATLTGRLLAYTHSVLMASEASWF